MGCEVRDLEKGPWMSRKRMKTDKLSRKIASEVKVCGMMRYFSSHFLPCVFRFLL